MKVIVNGREKYVGARLTFEEVVKLACEGKVHLPVKVDPTRFTVTYFYKRGPTPLSGSLSVGGVVDAREGMIFDAAVTSGA